MKIIISRAFTMLVVWAVMMQVAFGQLEWSPIEQLRCGQINTISDLRSAAETSIEQTNFNITYDTFLTGSISSLEYGLSLISYQSWMTDTFSFNVSLVELDLTSIQIKFLILDNTYFTAAKVHYLVSNYKETNPPDYYLEVLFGCYLTSDLLTGNGTRNYTVNNQTTTQANTSTAIVNSMLAGIQLSNSLGFNNQMQVTSYIDGGLLTHTAEIENNNYLKFFCLTTVITQTATNYGSFLNLVEFKNYLLDSSRDTGLKTIAYSTRFDGLNRMFFGMSGFNLTMNNTRYLNVETANISYVSLFYDTNDAINWINYHTFFFAKRNCTNGTERYDASTFSCVVNCPLNGAFDNTDIYGNAFCAPCHYSCLACSGASSSLCTSCEPTTFRSDNGGACQCNVGYLDIGQSICSLCNNTISGCNACQNITYCSSCNSGYTLNNVTNLCECQNNNYMVGLYCLAYPGCLEAQQYLNNINCRSCDSSLNFILNNAQQCKCMVGFIYNNISLSCEDICGDSISAVGFCDDGNTISGDGCSSKCVVESGYFCTYDDYEDINNTYGISSCVLKRIVSLTYLYAQKSTTGNYVTLAFELSPADSSIALSHIKSNIKTDLLPLQDIVVSYNSDKSIIFIQGQYTTDIQGQSLKLNMTYDGLGFYADESMTNFEVSGINARLVVETNNTQTNIIYNFALFQAVLALLLAIFANVVGLKLVGLQLLVPIQIIYFAMSTISTQSTYLHSLSSLKFINGFSALSSYQYLRTYDQLKGLANMQYQTQFLLSVNVMFILYFICLIWLLVHHILLRCKECSLDKYLEKIQKKGEGDGNDSKEKMKDQIQHQNNEEERRLSNHDFSQGELQQQEYKIRSDHHRSLKIFAFEVDRVYFILFFILINQITFGFIVMTQISPISNFHYSLAVNIVICNFLFFILVGNYVFIMHDQQTNKMINFTCIKDSYAYIFILLDFIVIMVIGFTFQEDFSIYLVTSICVGFVVLVIIQRPYTSQLLSLENVVALYCMCMLVASLVILCVLKSSPEADEMSHLICVYLIVIMIFIAEVLTIIRIIIKVNFNKAFDDLRNHDLEDDKTKKNKKVIQKNLMKLEDNEFQIIPPESIRKGLFTPKDKMIDWESRNTQTYNSIKHQLHRSTDNEEEKKQKSKIDEKEEDQEKQEQDEASEIKIGEKVDELELIKRRLRENLRLKKENQAKKN